MTRSFQRNNRLEEEYKSIGLVYNLVRAAGKKDKSAVSDQYTVLY